MKKIDKNEIGAYKEVEEICAALVKEWIEFDALHSKKMEIFIKRERIGEMLFAKMRMIKARPDEDLRKEFGRECSLISQEGNKLDKEAKSISNAVAEKHKKIKEMMKKSDALYEKASPFISKYCKEDTIEQKLNVGDDRGVIVEESGEDAIVMVGPKETIEKMR